MQDSKDNEKLIEELKEIIKEYEQRLNTKDKNFQLQFSELQNELIQTYSEIGSLKDEKNKINFQLTELTDLINEKDSVLSSKDYAIQIMQSDLKEQLENMKNHYDESLSIRHDEIESLLMTSSQLREQLTVRESDIISMMTRHEDQIIKLSQDSNSRDETSTIYHTLNALKEEISDLRELLFQKQESLNVASLQLDEQDKRIRQLTDKNLSLIDEANKYQKEMKYDQDILNNQLNEAAKENKKKQLTLKAKVKSLEKQCESLKTMSVNEQEQYSSLNKELSIREQVIDKQDTLIAELRQTETNLRRNLDRNFILQQEQLIELRYWQDINKLLPVSLNMNAVDTECDSLTPLHMALDTLVCIHEEQSTDWHEKIKEVIVQLKAHQKIVSPIIIRAKCTEGQLSLLHTYADQLHNSNIDLQKLLKGLMIKFENINEKCDIDTDQFDSIPLEDCSKECLLKRFQIILNNSSNYCEKIARLEIDNFNIALELNKLRGSNEQNLNDSINTENVLLQEKNELIRTIEILTEKISNRDKEIMDKDNESMDLQKHISFHNAKLEEKEHLRKTIEQLNEDLLFKTKEREDIVSNSNEEIALMTLKLEELNESLSYTIKDNEKLIKTIEQLKEEISLKNQDNVTLSDGMHEEILSLKLKVKESSVREDDIVKEKEHVMIALELLKEEIIIKDKDINRQSHDLNEQIVVLRSKLDEYIIHEDESLSEKGKLTKTIEELKEQIEFKDKETRAQMNQLNEQLAFLELQLEESNLCADHNIIEKEQLMMASEQLKEEIELKERDICNQSQTLNDQIISLKSKLHECSIREDESIKKKEQLIMTVEQMEQNNTELRNQSLDLNEKMATLKLKLEESLIQLDESIKEKSQLMKMIEQFKEKNALKDVETMTHTQDYNEQITLLKLQLKESGVREDELMTEKEHSIEIGEQLKEDMHIQAHDLNEQIVSLKLRLEESDLREEATIKEKGLLLITITQLQEDLSTNTKYVNTQSHDLNEQIESLKSKLDESNRLLEEIINERNKLLLSIEQLKEGIKIKEKDVSEGSINLNKIIESQKQQMEESRVYEESMTKEKQQLIKAIEQLKEEIISNEKCTETQSHDLSKEITTLKLQLEEVSVHGGEIIKEKEQLMKALEELKEEVQMKNNDKDALSRDLNEQIISLTLKLEESYSDKDVILKKKDLLMKIVEQLKEEILVLRNNTKIQSQHLVEQFVSLKMKFNDFFIGEHELVKEKEQLLTFIEELKKEMIFKENNSDGLSRDMEEQIASMKLKLEAVCSDKDENMKEKEQLKEEIMLKDIYLNSQLNNLTEEILSLNVKLQESCSKEDANMNEKEDLLKIVEQLKAEIIMKEKYTDEQSYGLKEEIVLLKLKLEESFGIHDEINKEKGQLMITIEQLKEEICARVEAMNSQSRDLNEDIVSEKLKLEELNLKYDEIIMDKKKLIETIDLLKGEIVVMEKDIDIQSHSLKEQIVMLNLKLEESSVCEDTFLQQKEQLMKTMEQLQEVVLLKNDEIEIVKEKQNLRKFIEEIMLKESSVKTVLIQLNELILSLKVMLEQSIKQEEEILKDKEELAKTCEQLNAELSLVRKININQETQYQVLNEELIILKSQLEDSQTKLVLTMDEKEKILTTIERLKVEILLKDKEGNDKEVQCCVLNEQIIALTLQLEDISTRNNEMKTMIESKNEEILLKVENMRDMEELCHELNEQIISVKLKSEEFNVNEAETLGKFKFMMNENKELMNAVEELKEEMLLKEEVVRENDRNIKDLNEQVICLHQRLEESCRRVRETCDNMTKIHHEKEELEKAKENSDKELENRMNSFKIELEDKEKLIQKLEKANLLLKAKSLKLKKQYDEKVASLSITTTKDVLVQSRVKSTDDISPQLSTYIYTDYSIPYTKALSTNLDSSTSVVETVTTDEMSFMNRIQSLSDEVDSRARKANLDIEKFLEKNEQVTSGLSLDFSPNKNILCDNSHCQRLLSKNRDLLVTITNLQEQNGLMKNKMMDLQRCMEHEQETRKQISQEGLLVHDSLVQKLHTMVTEKEEFITNQQALIQEKNVLDNISKELLLYKTQYDEQCISLTHKQIELERMNERLKDNERCISQLHEQCITLSNANATLATDNDTIVGLNNNLECFLGKWGGSTMISPIDRQNCLDQLCDNVKTLISLPDLRFDGYTDLDYKDIKTSLESFVDATKCALSSTIVEDSDMLRKQWSMMLENNSLIEEHLSIILERVDVISKKCLLVDGQNISIKTKLRTIVNEKQDLENRLREKDAEYEKLNTEMSNINHLIDTENVKVFRLEESARRSVTIESECDDCLRLRTELINAEISFINKLKDFIPLRHQALEDESKNNPRALLEYYIDVLKNQFNNQYKVEVMIESNVQTFMQASHFRVIEDLISSIIMELPDNHIIRQSDWQSDSIELWTNVINEMRNQTILLQDELRFQAQEKSELSDKFERLFIELERTCDIEIEEHKNANTMLNKEMESLQLERDSRESTLRNYEIQISYLQSVIDNSKNGMEKEQLVQMTNSDNSQTWLSNLNEALKETISEKEDHITELMDQINESSNRLKDSIARNEQQIATITKFELEIDNYICNAKLKEKQIQENNAVINELEAVCVEKENRINLMEKESNEINFQLEQYISAVCSMQARLEASKPNLELILTKIENKDNNMQLLNLIDQLEKDYAEELEQSELNRSKIELKLNKAVQIIHKLKKQLKDSHGNEVRLSEQLRTLKLECHCKKESAVLTRNPCSTDSNRCNLSSLQDASVQIDDEELRLLREENVNYKGIIENLHVNNFLLWKELDSVKNTDRNLRGSSLPPMNCAQDNSVHAESERSSSPVSQLSWNSSDGNTNTNQVKDLQRKLQRVHQQLNQMRIERNRIHQEYSRIRQLKEVADNKVTELMKKIDRSVDSDAILTEKDELIEANNHFSTQMVELQSEIEMTKVRNSILETKCKKIELKLTSQRRKYDQLVLKLDEKEQEMDRGSDELRKHVSNFEKDKIIWFREKKELKSSLTMKEEQITNLRKRLSSKTVNGEDCDSDYITEISQLQGQFEEQKSENKRLITRHREQLAKYQGQIEELIDDNRQLKRKLSFGHTDSSNQQTIESQKNTKSRMKVIEEDCEESAMAVGSHSMDMNTMFASVVLEKEKLLMEISDLQGLLESQKNNVSLTEKRVSTTSSQTDNEETRTVQDSCCGSDNIFTQVNKSLNAVVDSCVVSCQSQQFCEVVEETTQTSVEEFEKVEWEKKVDESVQVNSVLIANWTQTEAPAVVESLRLSKERSVCVNSVQTEVDDSIKKLQQDADNLRAQYRRQLSNNEHHLQLSGKLQSELDVTLNNMTLMESKNLEYQELIGTLELEQITRDKKYHEQMAKLSSEITQLREQVTKTTNPIVELNDKADQTLLCQPADEGWDMEWDYEKLTVEHQLQVDGITDGTTDNVCMSDTIESTIMIDENIMVTASTHSLGQSLPNDNMNNSICYNTNLIAILREEIENLKNTIGEKNSEIGQLKCLRNQLQTDLLESGQQIKDSNMEFLNLKENIQVLHAERDIQWQKVADLQAQFGELVNFIEMITTDLQRLRDTVDAGSLTSVKDKTIDCNRVKSVVQALEYELHKLLEQLRFKDSKLENAFFQIDQLSCAIHRLQLQQQQQSQSNDVADSVMIKMQHTHSTNAAAFDSTQTMTNGNKNIHDDCINSISELSELLEKKHQEIDGLKSRLFLATDQLIHFRTFFANSDNALHKELLLITRHHTLGFNDNVGLRQPSTRDHTRLTIDSDDQSDSDQSSLLSHDGNTVIRVERTHVPLYSRSTDQLWFLNRMVSSARYKRIVHNVKRLFGAGRRQMVLLRSQPRINIRAIIAIYLAVVHLLLMRCLLL